MAPTCAKGTPRMATPRSMPNRCQSMSTIEGPSVASRRLSAPAGSGVDRHQNVATPHGVWITKHACVWRTAPSAVSLKIGDLPPGLQVVEAPPPANGSVAGWMSIQPRGFVRMQDLTPVSLSHAGDVVVATSQSCDTAAKKREASVLRGHVGRHCCDPTHHQASTSRREQELSARQEALHLREADAALREHELVARKDFDVWSCVF